MTVKVAIDLALDRLFDYSVGPELEKKLSVGQLLLVPFGRREARGFAMSVSTEPYKGEMQLKDVKAIINEKPFFTSELLKLVKLISSYTAAPLESVLKAALPAAVLKKNMRPKQLLYVECEETIDKNSVEKLRPRQKWIYEQIVRLGGGWLNKLASELETTPATIRSLQSLSLVRVFPRQFRRDPMAGRKFLPTKPLALNDVQAAALSEIKNSTLPILLFGVTGSGKTEVYLQAIAAELEKGRGAIVMVPEISLTPQTMRRFAQRFGDKVALLHSALSDGERYDEWHRILKGEAKVVVGPRSAVFAPVSNLGLIVVDEEHESSYKQEETPRYNARDVAVLRGSIEGAKVVLGSATPSLESWMNVKNGKYVLVRMAKRAGAGTTPSVAIVDMTEGDAGIFSRQLLDAISDRLDRHEQTILLINRRGYSKSLVCSSCGASVDCPLCAVPYTYHKADSCLRCHICGKWRPMPDKCQECGGNEFEMKGLGIQRAEAALKKCFPRANVLRMDSDIVARKLSHDDILASFARGEADILIGTQMVAKGLDFPNVTLVGVLNADASLNQPDFRAAERTFQLLSQVAGRAGRAELSGEAIFQTRDPAARAIKLAAKSDYEHFAQEELEERRQWGFPPYCHLSVISLSSKDLKLVAAWADMYAKSLMSFAKGKCLKVGEATPSILEKADGNYRWQIVLRSERAGTLSAAWRWLKSMRPNPPQLRVVFDMDAHNMM